MDDSGRFRTASWEGEILHCVVSALCCPYACAHLVPCLAFNCAKACVHQFWHCCLHRFFGFLCPSGHANLLTTWWLLKPALHDAGCQIKAPCGGSASCSWFCFGGIYCTGEAAQVVSLEWADPARLDVENSYKHRWRFSTLLGLCYIEVMAGGWCVGSGQ